MILAMVLEKVLSFWVKSVCFLIFFCVFLAAVMQNVNNVKVFEAKRIEKCKG